MSLLKFKVLLGTALLCLTGGCLQSAGPASGEVSSFSPPAEQEMMAKTSPMEAADEGIKPKPDTSSLGNGKQLVWRAYYGEEASPIQGMATLTLSHGSEPTDLDLRVQKSEGDPQEWSDAPVGQKLRLFLQDAYADPLPDPATGDPLPQFYCDETVTALQGNPPENISTNALSFKLGTLLIFAEDPTNDFFDCANGWAPTDPAMASGLLAKGSAFVGNLTLKFPSLPPANRVGNLPTPPPDLQPSERILAPWKNGLPIHLP